MLTVYCKFRLSEKCCDDGDRLQMALTRSPVYTGALTAGIKNPRCIQDVPRIRARKHLSYIYGNIMIKVNTRNIFCAFSFTACHQLVSTEEIKATEPTDFYLQLQTLIIDQ